MLRTVNQTAPVGRRRLGILLTAAIGLSTLMAVPPGAAVAAEPAVPVIVETTSPEGFVHPGIGVTADQLQNVQEQVAAGSEPWASYYAAMAQTKYASKTYVAQNQGATDEQPKDNSYNEVAMRSRAHDDSLGGLTQAVMYAITGDEVYRANALHVLRTWSSLDPAAYAFFPDAHIHTGVPLYYFVTAAEILRATVPVNDSLAGYDLRWTDRDQQRAEDNLVRPTIDTFLYSQNRLWNQHTYGVLGMVAGAIFLDDAALYAQRVEWFSVNSTYQSEHTINGGDVNGGLSSLIREIDKKDPLNPYHKDFVQLVEMGRDQAHAEGDITTLSATARILNNQGTRLDPVKGTVSTSSKAVSPYRFLDDRLLAGADKFAEFMMGGEPPFIDPSGGASTLSQAYRGRLRELMNDLYYQYTYVEDVNVAKKAPSLARLHEQSDGPLYYYGSAIENFWNPRGSDFTDSEYWLAFPAELADEEVHVPAPSATAELSPVKYGLAVGKGAKVLTEQDGTEIARLDAKRDAVVAIRRIVWSSSPNFLVGINVRTHGQGTLQTSATATSAPFGEIALPDTKGAWTTVWVNVGAARTEGKAVGENILYLRALDSKSSVDIGGVLADATSTITPPVFADGNKLSFVAVAGEAISRSIAVSDADSGRALTLQGAPKGASIAADGRFSWTPGKEDRGDNSILVVADDGKATTTLPMTVRVAESRTAAIDLSLQGLAGSTEYTAETWAVVDDATEAARSGLGADTATFASLLEDLRHAVLRLALLNPRLADGTLDYSLTATSPELSQATMRALVDGSNQTTWGDRRDTSVELDFGAGHRVQADRFGLMARDTFANRSEGTNIYGSNDGASWTLLTEQPNQGDDAGIEYLEVRDEVQGERYRYLRLQVDAPGVPTDPLYPGIWTQADFRIDGVRSAVSVEDQLAQARAADLSGYSRGSAVVYTRELDAIEAALAAPDADSVALAARLQTATSLLQQPPFDSIDVQSGWTTASTRSWDGKKDAAGNGWAMFDGDTATYTDTTTAGGWVTVVPPSGTTLTIEGLRFVPRATYVSRAVGMQFQGSVDGGGTWTTFATIANPVEGWNQLDLATPVSTGAVRVLASTGNTNLAEVEFISSRADRSALALYTGEVADLVQAEWTADTWTALDEARFTAQQLLDDKSTDQAAIDAAADELAAAIAGLKRAG